MNELAMRTITTNILILILLLTVCGSCTKALIHFEQWGEVSIRPEVTATRGDTLIAMTYHFYPAAGGEVITRPSDENGAYEGTLPVGTYNYIAVSATVEGVDFVGMQHFATATAQKTQINSTRAGEYLFGQPGMLHTLADNLNLIEVVAGDTVRREPPLTPLTCVVTLHFALDADLRQQIASIDGVLRGVMPWINLGTRKPQNGGINNIALAAMTFGTAPDESGFVATINLFGMADPDYGNSYNNMLSLTIVYTDGTVEEMAVDLTNLISGVMAQNEGVIPIELPLQIDIHQTDIGLQAEVIGWVNSGESEKEI